jgi:hypothetical protein
MLTDDYTEDEQRWALAVMDVRFDAKRHAPCQCSEDAIFNEMVEAFWTAAGNGRVSYSERLRVTYAVAKNPADAFQRDLRLAALRFPRTAQRRIEAVELVLMLHGRMPIDENLADLGWSFLREVADNLDALLTGLPHSGPVSLPVAARYLRTSEREVAAWRLKEEAK